MNLALRRWFAAAFVLLVSCPSVALGAGVALSPQGMAVEASGDLVVVDAVLAAVVRVDPVMGNPSIVSDVGRGAGPALSVPTGIAAEASGDLVVIDSDLDAVFRVDPVTGDRTVVSGAGTGAGPAFSGPADIAVEASGDLVVIDSDLDAVFRVDPVTGDRTVISDVGTGVGPTLMFPAGIAVEASGDLVVTDFGVGAVFRVDPVTGDRTVVSDAGTGVGPTVMFPVGIAVEASGNLVVTGLGQFEVVRVDPVTGDRSVVSGPGMGAGPAFPNLLFVGVEASGDLLVIGAGPDAVFRVGPLTGDRALLEACPTTPKPACATGFARSALTVVESKPGKERLKATLGSGPGIDQADLGDPTIADGTAFAFCVYDGAGDRVSSLLVNRAGEECAGKPCWTSVGGDPPTGKGYVYKDKDADASGVSKILLKAGVAGRSKLQVKAGNNATKGRSSLPTGIAAGLLTTTSVKMQFVADTGACYEVTLSDIKKQGSDLFKAK